ncbi:hypothetical protein BH24ACT7_BH24ACT7_25640 [soil metagenome]
MYLWILGALLEIVGLLLIIWNFKNVKRAGAKFDQALQGEVDRASEPDFADGAVAKVDVRAVADRLDALERNVDQLRDQMAKEDQRISQAADKAAAEVRSKVADLDKRITPLLHVLLNSRLSLYGTGLIIVGLLLSLAGNLTAG